MSTTPMIESSLMPKIGRPPLHPDDRSLQISLRVPSKQFDHLCQRAREARCSLAEIVRRSLRPGVR
jgi:hypothetical protein